LCISDYHLIISIISVSFCIRSKNFPFAFNAFAKLTICEEKKRVGLPLHVLDGFFAAEDAARTPAQPSVYSSVGVVMGRQVTQAVLEWKGSL
jgi:hypothetical protein